MRFYDVIGVENYQEAENGEIEITALVLWWLGKKQITVAKADGGGVMQIGLKFDEMGRLRIRRLKRIGTLDAEGRRKSD